MLVFLPICAQDAFLTRRGHSMASNELFCWFYSERVNFNNSAAPASLKLLGIAKNCSKLFKTAQNCSNRVKLRKTTKKSVPPCILASSQASQPSRNRDGKLTQQLPRQTTAVPGDFRASRARTSQRLLSVLQINFPTQSEPPGPGERLQCK